MSGSALGLRVPNAGETKISVSVRDEDLDEVLSYLTDRGCQCVVRKKKR